MIRINNRMYNIQALVYIERQSATVYLAKFIGEPTVNITAEQANTILTLTGTSPL